MPQARQMKLVDTAEQGEPVALLSARVPVDLHEWFAERARGNFRSLTAELTMVLSQLRDEESLNAIGK